MYILHDIHNMLHYRIWTSALKQKGIIDVKNNETNRIKWTEKATNKKTTEIIQDHIKFI